MIGSQACIYKDRRIKPLHVNVIIYRQKKTFSDYLNLDNSKLLHIFLQ